MLLAGAVVAWLAAGLVSADAQVAVAGCCAVAAAIVVWEETRRERALTEMERRQAAEAAALRRRWADQETETIRLATELLPAAVERLQRGAVAEEALSGLAPDPRLSPRLGAAHDAVLRSVIDAVEAQVGLHDSAQRAFVNIARRVQAIVHQQAQDLRAMEDKHGENPDIFGDLLHLDHGTALIGRLADSIAVLGGARPGRQWRQDVPLFNVLRGAMSRIADYKRVDLHSVAEFAVVGPAVEPLIHALAELLDNATRYSPPQARVHLTAAEVQSGVAVEIEDAGVGLTEEARARAEWALAQGSGGIDLDDLGESPRLGLAVVGRLAAANDFTVALRPSVYGGVRAVLTVPKELITLTPVPGGKIARAATLPPPRPRPRPGGGPVRVEPEAPAGEFPRDANGLPQRRRRRGAPVPAAPRPAGPAPAPAGTRLPGEPAKAAAEPGLWLADFHNGISGDHSGPDADRPDGDDASWGEGE
ncbi:sensor histidine kinase [Actinomadura sp. 21ATH]|uniref:sensor histidine kinase n=1 Tax=Actinomadura sp. 21ATH TaxID=1735444 RepID=UPI0035C08531